MTVRIDGTNSTANPAITGADADTGLQFGTDEVKIVTGGSDRVTVDSSGRLLVGTSSASEANSAVFKGNSSSSTGPGVIDLARASTPSTDQQIGALHFSSNDDTRAASIFAARDGATWTDGSDQPSRLVFSTTADGASSPTERMRIDNAGLLKFDSGYGSAATAYGCRAWINFNGTGTVAIRDSGNISSITDDGTGIYEMDFATALVDANYSVSFSGRLTAGGFDLFGRLSSVISTTSLRMLFSDGSSAADGETCTVMVVR